MRFGWIEMKMWLDIPRSPSHWHQTNWYARPCARGRDSTWLSMIYWNTLRHTNNTETKGDKTLTRGQNINQGTHNLQFQFQLFNILFEHQHQTYIDMHDTRSLGHNLASFLFLEQVSCHSFLKLTPRLKCFVSYNLLLIAPLIFFSLFAECA